MMDDCLVLMNSIYKYMYVENYELKDVYLIVGTDNNI